MSLHKLSLSDILFPNNFTSVLVLMWLMSKFEQHVDAVSVFMRTSHMIELRARDGGHYAQVANPVQCHE